MHMLVQASPYAMWLIPIQCEQQSIEETPPISVVATAEDVPPPDNAAAGAGGVTPSRMR